MDSAGTGADGADGNAGATGAGRNGFLDIPSSRSVGHRNCVSVFSATNSSRNTKDERTKTQARRKARQGVQVPDQRNPFCRWPPRH
jgi:hypothetical protein